MTQEQYDRWKDFARRMVNVAVSSRKRAPSRAHTLEIIEFFFECRMEPDEWQRVESWDHTEGTEGESYPMCVGDHMSDIAEYHVPGYWSLPDGDRGDEVIDRWMGPAMCCVRAGLGAAIEGGSGVGVMGFTAGDIRKMYPEGVPDWVKNGAWESIGVAAIVPGVGFVPERKGDAKSFDDLPNDVEVWL